MPLTCIVRKVSCSEKYSYRTCLGKCSRVSFNFEIIASYRKEIFNFSDNFLIPFGSSFGFSKITKIDRVEFRVKLSFRSTRGHDTMFPRFFTARIERFPALGKRNSFDRFDKEGKKEK